MIEPVTPKQRRALWKLKKAGICGLLLSNRDEAETIAKATARSLVRRGFASVEQVERALRLECAEITAKGVAWIERDDAERENRAPREFVIRDHVPGMRARCKTTYFVVCVNCATEHHAMRGTFPMKGTSARVRCACGASATLTAFGFSRVVPGRPHEWKPEDADARAT